MNTNTKEPVLIIRVKGKATEGGRIGLHDLIRLGNNVQTAVERVARVLVGQADSRRPGRKPSEIAQSCALEVVALNQGSFAIAFDLPNEKFETMHLGVEAVEKLFEGLDQIGTNGEALPSGYDAGVLHTLRDMGRILGRGIDMIEAESRTQRLRKTFSFTNQTRQRIIERIRGPVSNLRSIEGRLLMADFQQRAEQCRIHPALGDPIRCRFDESLEQTVYDYLRSQVRVTGETTEDPNTGRISSITITDIEPVTLEGAEPDSVSPDAFWQDKSLEELAVEQAVSPITRLEDIWGAGSDLWENDGDFDAFVSATKGDGVQGP